jgi:hypothetical protein
MVVSIASLTRLANSALRRWFPRVVMAGLVLAIHVFFVITRVYFVITRIFFVITREGG